MEAASRRRAARGWKMRALDTMLVNSPPSIGAEKSTAVFPASGWPSGPRTRKRSSGRRPPSATAMGRATSLLPSARPPTDTNVTSTTRDVSRSRPAVMDVLPASAVSR